MSEERLDLAGEVAVLEELCDLQAEELNEWIDAQAEWQAERSFYLHLIWYLLKQPRIASAPKPENVAPPKRRPSKQPDPPPIERLAYRQAEVARMLGVSPSFVSQLIDAGRIKAFRAGRAVLVSADEVKRFAEGRAA